MDSWGDGGTYHERRCGIADSCGPYLDVCTSQQVRSHEKERTMGVTVQPCHRVRRAEWRGASCFRGQPELLRRIKRVSICHGHEASEERLTTLRHLHQEKFFALYR
jgi:hypothetical protein